ncbi:MAG: bifunctional nicotinamidase/pyrazinamidase [Fibrobacterota bacterium]|nr:bifunctional nicotinamidase/pyrazinamidase [Chitinispirillaceae bacterium]
MNALIIVDVQYDFLPGGALAVADGDAIISIINSIRDRFDMTLFTQDYHPVNHCSFKVNGGIWPVHCVEATHGATIHTDLLRKNDIIVKKGVNTTIDSYSGFYDNERKTKTDLDSILKQNNVDTVHICGLATDYCVKYTAIDAVREGYKTILVKDACRGVNLNPGDVDNAIVEMQQHGVEILTHWDV